MAHASLSEVRLEWNVKTDRTHRPWVMILLMVLATAWYAWPQALYSLFPIYDLFRFLFPAWAESLRPWVEAIRASVGR